MGVAKGARVTRTSAGRCGAAAVLLFAFAAHTRAADFSVGGSIANLAGSGLVLRLDTQDACIASGNVSSVTNSSAAGGVLQCGDAATQKCCTLTSFNFQSTTNQDGTINCSVTCGTIIGAPSGSPQVTAQATQTVSPPAGATSYVFATAVADGSPYTVSVDTQPSSPAQVCSVENPSGTILGGDVTNANVTCTTVTHTVTATAGANGSVSPSSQSVNDGSTATVTLTADAGFTAGASGCGGSLGGDGTTYTTAAITADCTVAATFTAIPRPPTPLPTLNRITLFLLGISVLGIAWRRWQSRQ